MFAGQQLTVLERLKERLTTLNVGTDLQYRFHLFKPTTYQTFISLTLPYTRQLERPEISGSRGQYRPIYTSEDNKYKPRSARRNAKDLICKQVLLNHLGQEQYDEVVLL